LQEKHVMTKEELIELINSNEAARLNHLDFSIWLHNKIVEKIQYDLWELREGPAGQLNSGYAALCRPLNLESIKPIN